MNLHRELNAEEQEEFKGWARYNFNPYTDKINPVWHPVVIQECNLMLGMINKGGVDRTINDIIEMLGDLQPEQTEELKYLLYCINNKVIPLIESEIKQYKNYN